ncbi:hypothetical protein FHR93_002416 [Geodermatophilus sabuli]|uniref:Uncharacterized protein n=1 Tax=Geodermatophilus sabuli TaxID=1564158 RepID=A0A285EEM7_9ACTN|nr:hypothetical protein [Geodermatophilus sabuli]SNX96526.1 hypothetical protein SAMN06893097_104241 [Geodermatophilus sabuli]
MDNLRVRLHRSVELSPLDPAQSPEVQHVLQKLALTP